MALVHSLTGLDARYSAEPPQVAAIRRDVSVLATRWGADLDTLTRIELAVSEAATNVVLHAYRAPAGAGEIYVTATCDETGYLDVRVRDSGIGLSPRGDSPGLGLGLSLMAHESDELEIRAADDGGTEVRLRFEIAVRPSADRHFARAGAGAGATAWS